MHAMISSRKRAIAINEREREREREREVGEENENKGQRIKNLDKENYLPRARAEEVPHVCVGSCRYTVTLQYA